MTEEVTPAPEAASQDITPPETPATETAASGEQQTPETPASTDDNGGDANGEKTPKREPWYQKRIDELTRARREEERKNIALTAMLEQQGVKPEQQAVEAQADPYEIAKQIAATERLNDAANRTYEAGKAAHPDFDQAVMQMAQVADISRRPDFLEAVTALPNAHEVYYHLGKNLDDAAHVLSLPPVRMAIELASISAKVGRPKAQSKAPEPVTPIGSKAVPSGELSDELSQDEWMRRRQAQLEARRKR